jgi:mannose-1-phosphate guanylyltransferase / mannose-6-phosphate isomerase
MQQLIIPAIMSGGAGTRLWPLSTEARPKQFHALGGTESLFVQTLARVSGETGRLAFAAPIVLANAAHAELVTAHLGPRAPAAVVLEPQARNTAAPAAIAAALAAEIAPEALVLLLPADHIIADVPAFHDAIARAAAFAHERIVTFGVSPTRAETGYGYIKAGAALGDGVYAIDSFREKPNAETAARYLAEGGYCWNAGMFLFSPRVLLQEFAPSAAIRDGALAALRAARRGGAFVHLDAGIFAQIPSLPLDIAVMEKTGKGAVAPCDIGWADVGAWDEVWRLSPRDEHGNAQSGAVVSADNTNTLVCAEGVRVCVAGMSDVIVIATPEAVLVLPRARAQEVKALREHALKLK